MTVSLPGALLAGQGDSPRLWGGLRRYRVGQGM